MQVSLTDRAKVLLAGYPASLTEDLALPRELTIELLRSILYSPEVGQGEPEVRRLVDAFEKGQAEIRDYVAAFNWIEKVRSDVARDLRGLIVISVLARIVIELTKRSHTELAALVSGLISYSGQGSGGGLDRHPQMGAVFKKLARDLKTLGLATFSDELLLIAKARYPQHFKET